MSWTPNKLEQERLDKLHQLQAAGVESFPKRVQRTHTTAEAIASFETIERNDPEKATNVAVTVCGRIRRVNIKGKVSFMHIEDESGRLQLFLRIDSLGEDSYQLIKNKTVEVDDFVQATGTMMRTRAGEASVLVTEFTLLTKTVSPLPVIKQKELEDGNIEEFGQFKDVESRYRQRYADLAVNQTTRSVFRKRARIIRALRDFLDQLGFLEVETPVLQPVYGGAAARPFLTTHNQLKQDLYLRISFELYLKRLLVGGYDAVYEIGRDFRNEGVSIKHNPEFTMLEFYKAYIDYHGVMDLTERLLNYVAMEVLETTTFEYQGHTIDFSIPWRRMTIREIVQETLGIDYMDYPDSESLATYLRDELGEKTKPGEPWGRLVVEHLFGNHVEPTIIQPTFIMDFPYEVSPFAKRVDNDDVHVERFELYIAGMEMGNAFTELNDPLEQEQRFHEMAARYRIGDDEETPLEEDYLRAMRYGMPPCGGIGIGVDRLVMLLTDQRTIRDVLLFPHLREQS